MIHISRKLLNFRWFDEKVSSLELSAPLTILPELSVEQTLSIMTNEGFDQLPVIESSGYVYYILMKFGRDFDSMGSFGGPVRAL